MDRQRESSGGMPNTMRQRPLFGAAIVLAGALIATVPALAETFEQAREKCRESVGRPIVQSCMHAKGYGPGSGKGRDVTAKDADLEQCRSKASPSVQACVQKAMANARPNVPVAMPQEKASRGAGAGRSAGELRGTAAHHRRHYGAARRRKAGCRRGSRS